MKKRPSITLLTVLLAMVFAAGIGVYSSYIGMKIYQESSDHLLESFSQISETFTLFVQRNWTVLSQWDGQLKNADIAHADSIGADMRRSGTNGARMPPGAAPRWRSRNTISH